jgi:hypothetical protein
MQAMTLTKDRPVLSSERAPHKKKQDRNRQTVLNIWSLAPNGARQQDLLTDWPSVAMWLRLWLELAIQLEVRIAPVECLVGRRWNVSNSELSRMRSELSQRSDQNWVSPGKKGSAEDSPWVTAIYCDYEWLYKEWSINPIIQSKPLLISHPYTWHYFSGYWRKLFPFIHTSTLAEVIN